MKNHCTNCYYFNECGNASPCGDFITEDEYIKEYNDSQKAAVYEYLGWHSADKWYLDEQ